MLRQEKTIIVVEDKLEKYLKRILFKKTFINFITTKLNNLSKTLNEIKIKKEDFLIIINKDIYNDKTKNEIKNIFISKLNINNPYILLMSLNLDIMSEQEKSISEQIFYYNLPKKKKIEELYSFLSLIFHHIEDTIKLNEYIISSFQTIVDSEMINQQKQKIESLYKELETISKIDTLTNVLNRKAFFEAMEREKSRAERDLWRIINTEDKFDLNNKKIIAEKIKKYHKPEGNFLDHYGKFSCLMIDIDFFKQVNDKYGHLIGDEVLRQVGELLSSKKIFRDIDIAGRYGGEEFIVILPETSAIYAKTPANRFKENIKAINFNNNNETFNISVSIGISEYEPGDTSCEDIINKADKALYYAKNHGRDSVVLYNDIC